MPAFRRPNVSSWPLPLACHRHHRLPDISSVPSSPSRRRWRARRYGMELWHRARACCTSFLWWLSVLVWVVVYYASSSASGVWNKALVDSGVDAGVLTLLHLVVSLASDVGLMRLSNQPLPRFPPTHGRHTALDVAVAFVPIALMIVTGKLATYLSYRTVSLGLSHTAKAAEPLFNVAVAALLFGETHPRAVYMSLLPIAGGVGLASCTDFTYNHIGFLWAVTSALLKVLQNLWTKRVMTRGRFSFFEVHLYCGAVSTIMLVPLLIWQMRHDATNPFTVCVACAVSGAAVRSRQPPALRCLPSAPPFSPAGSLCCRSQPARCYSTSHLSHRTRCCTWCRISVPLSSMS